MKAMLCVDKIVLNASDIIGNGDINDLRKIKKWNTSARREKMLNRIKMKPERFVTNYQWMLNQLGEKETVKAVKAAICQLFNSPTRSQVILFEKETGNRRSSDLKGTITNYQLVFYASNFHCFTYVLLSPY